MDSLIELIDNRIDKAFGKSSYVNSALGLVTNIDGGSYLVRLITTGATYKIPNYSGSDVAIGQTVHVYWRGGFLSNQTAYIGATLSKQSNVEYIYGSKTTATLSTNDQTVMSFSFTAQTTSTVTLTFNAQIESSENGTVMFTIVVNDTALLYTPKQSVASGYAHCSFTLPVAIATTGTQSVVVKAKGVGSIAQIESFIMGQGIGE